MVSLGCAKNRVDSEVMLGYLKQAGFRISTEPEECHILIINTCAFISSAREEAVSIIREMAEYKEKGKCRRLVVTGCLPQLYRHRLLHSFPQIDYILGVDYLHTIVELCQSDSLPRTKHFAFSSNPTYLYDHLTPRVLSTPPYSAYVKIAEGCSHACAFCLVPALRGRYRSREVDSVVAEVEGLVAQGVREVNLVAQDTTFFGFDRGEKGALVTLLKKLVRISDLKWLRLLYCQPERVDDQLLEVMAEEEKVCSYLDIPLQHVDKELLRLMGRKGDRDSFTALISRIRKMVPDIALRTTFMVGFPSDSEDKFRFLYDFCREMEFDHVGVFTYCREKGTRAYRYGNPVPQEVKEDFKRRLMELQASISLKKNRAMVGKLREVLIDGERKENSYPYWGRLSIQAPEVDGVVFISEGESRPGEFVSVRIEEGYPYDLVGRIRCVTK